MSLEAIEQEEKDRTQYELKLLGRGGRKWGAFCADRKPLEKQQSGPVKLESREDYMLTLKETA